MQYVIDSPILFFMQCHVSSLQHLIAFITHLNKIIREVQHPCDHFVVRIHMHNYGKKCTVTFFLTI